MGNDAALQILLQCHTKIDKNEFPYGYQGGLASLAIALISLPQWIISP